MNGDEFIKDIKHVNIFYHSLTQLISRFKCKVKHYEVTSGSNPGAGPDDLGSAIPRLQNLQRGSDIEWGQNRRP